MRNYVISFVAVVVLIGTAAAADPTPVGFDIHDGYFVSNKFEPNAPTSFVVLQDQTAFDRVFGAAVVMRDKSHRLPPDAFKTKMVVAAIHRGKAFWKYTVQAAEAQDKVLTIRYSTTSTPNETASFACPLIVSLDKGDYAAVQFVEDGKAVKKVLLGAATTQPAKAGTLESFKGWELYVWQDNGETFCSLMVGTNRNKTDDEIEKAANKGVEAAKAKLVELKAGQWVTIMGRKRGQNAPQDVVRELSDYCRSLGLKAQ